MIAVIATAGNGTRFMPATKVVPKEMLPIINRPIIQILVDEIKASGINDIVIVSNKKYKGVMKKYFKGEEGIKVIYQKGNKYGNAIPALMAKKYIKDKFLYLYGDDLVLSEIPACKQLIDYGYPSMMVAEVDKKEASSYGIVGLKEGGWLKEIDEKPENPKSNLASIGRFYVPKEILKEIKVGKNGEYWFVDAVNRLNKKYGIYVKTLKGKWLTTGDPMNYKKALDTYHEEAIKKYAPFDFKKITNRITRNLDKLMKEAKKGRKKQTNKK
jgi:UTP-glucose-1-phosphate uridylyltransferase